jgi:hypothetical protein
MKHRILTFSAVTLCCFAFARTSVYLYERKVEDEFTRLRRPCVEADYCKPSATKILKEHLKSIGYDEIQGNQDGRNKGDGRTVGRDGPA